MAQEDLLHTLNALQKCISNSSQIDSTAAKKLQVLIEEIELALATSAPEADSPTATGTLTQRIQSIIDDFEVHHPKLTANLSLIAERLADMGI